MCGVGICICPPKTGQSPPTRIGGAENRDIGTATTTVRNIDRDRENVESSEDDDYDYIADYGIDWSAFKFNECPRYVDCFLFISCYNSSNVEFEGDAT